MSFGFSPGDIVMMIKFADKVVGALREEGGSMSEYRLAERQCRGFITVANQVLSLDLSRLPDSFQAQIRKYSAELVEHIQDFRETIEHYENAMGEGRKRGWFSSAPRKVQWAFRAARDLESFRQTLKAQFDLLTMVIQTSILSFLNNNNNNNDLGDSLPWKRNQYIEFRPQNLLGWESTAMRNIVLHQEVDYITEIVYGRLLRRPGIPIQLAGTARTLDDGVSIDQVFPPPSQETYGSIDLEAPKSLETASSNTAVSHLASSGSGAVTTDRTAVGYNALSDDLDDYFQTLGLKSLTEEERQYFNSIDGTFSEGRSTPMPLLDFPTSGARRLSTSSQHGNNEQPAYSTTPGPGTKQRAGKQSSGHQQKSSNSRQTTKSFFPNTSNTSAPDSLDIAASIAAMVSYAAMLSRNSERAYAVYGPSGYDLVALSRSLSQFSCLLIHISTIIFSSSSRDEELRSLGNQIQQDAQEILREVERKFFNL